MGHKDHFKVRLPSTWVCEQEFLCIFAAKGVLLRNDWRKIFVDNLGCFIDLLLLSVRSSLSTWKGLPNIWYRPSQYSQSFKILSTVGSPPWKVHLYVSQNSPSNLPPTHLTDDLEARHVHFDQTSNRNYKVVISNISGMYSALSLLELGL